MGISRNASRAVASAVVLIAACCGWSGSASAGPAPLEGEDRCLYLDGQSALQVSLDAHREAFKELTLEVWVKGLLPTGPAAIAGNIDPESTAEGGFGLFWNEAGEPYCTARARSGSVFHTVRGERWWHTQEWTHVAYVYDGKLARLFVDGEPVATVAHAKKGPLLPGAGKLYIGAAGRGGKRTGYFRGCLDELRLSATARYKRSFQPRTRLDADKHTVLLFHFDAEATTNAPEHSGHSRIGEAVGTPRIVARDHALRTRDHKLIGSRDPKLLERARDAATRGIEFLKTQQLPDGRWQRADGAWSLGQTAFVTASLLYAGENRFDETFEKSFKFLNDFWNQAIAAGGVADKWRTYDIAYTLLALKALEDWMPPGQRRPLVRDPLRKPRVTKLQLAWVKAMREQLIATMQGPGAAPGTAVQPVHWAYPDKDNDLNNTAAAVMALRAASELGYPSDVRVWAGVMDLCLRTQAAKGPKVRRVVLRKDPREAGLFEPISARKAREQARGWAYRFPSYAPAGIGKHADLDHRGSMTCAALTCLIIAGGELSRYAEAKDKIAKRFVKKRGDEYAQAVRDGLAWLGYYFSPTGNAPNGGEWTYFQLFGMQRVGQLADADNFGYWDWYREGAEFLLAQQRADGSWVGTTQEEAIESTCCALMFLTRATTPPRTALTYAAGSTDPEAEQDSK
ncbi:MAG: LamG domain-containing protein [Planctomycetota bacterium]|jgi:hypothetical protein